MGLWDANNCGFIIKIVILLFSECKLFMWICVEPTVLTQQNVRIHLGSNSYERQNWMISLTK
jgi:hypothetical protein